MSQIELNRQLSDRLREAEEALAFYADEKTYLPFDHGHRHNGGQRARAYLSKHKGKV